MTEETKQNGEIKHFALGSGVVKSRLGNGVWHSRLWTRNGEHASRIEGKHKSLAGLRKWAKTKLDWWANA